MRERRLVLKKEAVVELTTRELDAVAGGGPVTTTCNPSWVTCNGPCDSDFQQCMTGLGCVMTSDC